MSDTESKIKILTEIGKQAAFLDNSKALIQENFENQHVLEEMALSSGKITKLGEAFPLKIVVQIGEALHSCFEAARKKHLTWTRGHLDLLIEAIDFLKRLAASDIKMISSWIDKHGKNADAIATILLAISRESSRILQKNAKKKEDSELTSLPQAKEIKPKIGSGGNGIEGSIKEGSEQKNSDPGVDSNLFALFYSELEMRVREMVDGLLALEKHPEDYTILEGLMRAAHSIKGAARIVELPQISRLAHALEEFFTYIPAQHVLVTEQHIDQLLQGVDLFERLAQVPYENVDTWLKNHAEKIDQFVCKLSELPEQIANPEGENPKKKVAEEKFFSYVEKKQAVQSKATSERPYKKNKTSNTSSEDETSSSSSDPFLRVSATILNRLMGLAGEALVESRWLMPYLESLVLLKRAQAKVAREIEKLSDYLARNIHDDRAYALVQTLKLNFTDCHLHLTERISDLELYMQRQTSLSDRLYAEVISSRMRPFADGIEFFPRVIRDLSKQLNKKVNFFVEGKNIPVDREILEKLESPLNHLIRNAIDHGIELPEERIKKGKTEAGTIKIEVSHRAGMLSIVVSDDGKGIDLKKLTEKVIEKGFVTRSMAENLSETELLDFVFLPGFSMSLELTELSGRGIGLNIVQNMVQEVGGTIKAVLGDGLSFHLQLPLTLSVIRALLVEISGEPYAIPLGRLKKVQLLSKDFIQTVEHRQYFHVDGKNIGLISAQQFLGLPIPLHYYNELCVLIISDGMHDYGVIVDKFLGEKELVVHELDPKLGKVPDISGGAFLEDGSPILIIDVEEMFRSIDKQLSRGSVGSFEFHHTGGGGQRERKKRILVVEDSMTVREVECRLLRSCGYSVDTAINGIEGWSAVRMGGYDLVITDVDMPRMNGIELVRSIRGDAKYRSTPVIVVSYKERESDRIEGLQAGANYYLAKSSFHDESLLNAVRSLIGESE